MSYFDDCWTILEIEKTNDKKVIKYAYAKLLKKYHPEEAPEQFQRIQQAYKQALNYANQTDEPISLEQQDHTLMTDTNQSVDHKPSTHTMENHEENLEQPIHTIEFMNIENEQNQGVDKTKDKKSILFDTDLNVVNTDAEVHTSIFNNTSIDESQVVTKTYLLQKFERDLERSLSKDTITLFFIDSDVQVYIKDPTFVEQVEAILVRKCKKMDEDILASTQSYANAYKMNKLLRAIEKRKKGAKFSKIKKGAVIYVLVILSFTLRPLLTHIKNDKPKVNQQVIEKYNQLQDERYEELLNEKANDAYVSIRNMEATRFGLHYGENEDINMLYDANNELILQEPVLRYKSNNDNAMLLLTENGWSIYFEGIAYPTNWEDASFVTLHIDGVQQGVLQAIIAKDVNGYAIYDTQGRFMYQDQNNYAETDTFDVYVEQGEIVRVELN
ncbi:DnaJ-like protein [Breznakia blatticola]|uniref:DnaJ-like protein n=1 Tax=Breznakia blatticola TaxID=1754012 RepID=A0A4R7ZI07_9FIRM|nr:J domain-containing protein [Breznakia blatticola]TDW14670.1 DnaJ-like protein [Breznakia blatticola]